MEVTEQLIKKVELFGLPKADYKDVKNEVVQYEKGALLSVLKQQFESSYDGRLKGTVGSRIYYHNVKRGKVGVMIFKRRLERLFKKFEIEYTVGNDDVNGHKSGQYFELKITFRPLKED